MSLQGNKQKRKIYAPEDDASEEAAHAYPFRYVLFLLLVLSIIVNLIPFHLLGFSHLAGYPAIIKLANTGIVSRGTILHRCGLYIAVNQTAPGVNMILPTGCPLDIAQLYGLGRAKSIIYKNYNPETIFSDFDFSDHVVASFNGNRRFGPGPFSIATGESKPETMIALKRNGGWYIVDTTLLPARMHKE